MESEKRAMAIEWFHSGKLDETERLCLQTLQSDALDAQAHHLLGLSRYRRGDLESAEVALKEAIHLDPNNAMYHNHLGSVLCAIGQSDKGIVHYHTAIARAPEMADAHYNLGNALQNRFQLSAALKSYQKAAAINPDFVEVLVNLCSVYRNQGNFEQSLEILRTAIERFPENIALRSNYLLTLNYILESGSESLREHTEMAGLFDHGYPADSQYLERSESGRLKIGYLSPDFKCHSVAWFMEPILKYHDRNSCEVYCYSNLLKQDDVTKRLKSYADHWRDINAMSDHEVAEQVRKDGIEILVDLAGHTSNHRLSLFGLHPAPIQVNYLGYPNTTGMQNMDYRLTDKWADPVGSEKWCTEKLVRLPEGFLCYSPQESAPEVSASPIDKKGFVTFGCFNAMAKIRPQLIRSWCRILKSVPGSRIIIKNTSLADKGVRKHLHNLFRKNGVQPRRVLLYEKCPSFEEHMALYHDIDIGLDSYPYNGTTTTCEALWMGVPVVTQSGEVHASRVGASLLLRLGLDDLVAETAEDYVSKAVSLASNPDKMAGLRLSLRQRMREKICDGKRFTASLEDVYRQFATTGEKGAVD